MATYENYEGQAKLELNPTLNNFNDASYEYTNYLDSNYKKFYFVLLNFFNKNSLINEAILIRNG